jgi:hypothetical protein
MFGSTPITFRGGAASSLQADDSSTRFLQLWPASGSRALLRTYCGQSTMEILQSFDSWLQGRSHLATTPLIACVPK